MHTTANASWSGIQHIFWALDTVRVKGASTYFPPQTSSLVALDMQARSTGTKLSKNTLLFGTLTSMLCFVRNFFKDLIFDYETDISSANFLSNHYREATKQISVLTAELAIIQSELGLTDANFPRFLKEEHDYLDGLKQPPEKDRLSVRYVEVLDELAERR